MKLLLCWPSAEFSIFDVANGLKNALENKGHEVVDYKLYNRIKIMALGARAITPEDKDIDLESVMLLAAEGLLYKTVVNDCRWVFIVSGMGLHPNGVVALKRVGIKVATWFTESPYDDNEFDFAKLCDVAFINERTSIDEFKIYCNNVSYLPHSYNPAVHFPVQSEKTIDVLFVGTGFDNRQGILEQVDFTGINFQLGGLWNGISEPSHLSKYLKYPCIDNSELVKLYHQTKIALNIHRWHENAESCNPRVFEVAACGIFQVSDYRKEIEDIFGNSIPLYERGNPIELASMLRYYLAHDQEREFKARVALKKVKEFTFDNNIKTIMDVIENSSKFSL